MDIYRLQNSYQRPTYPFPRRHWKAILSSQPVASSPDGEDEDMKPEHVRYLRWRVTRLGGLMLDRRDAFIHKNDVGDVDSTSLRRRRVFGRSLEEIFDDPEDDERMRRLRERWRFDQDDDPLVGPQGAEAQDRVLIDDYSPRYLRHAMTLLTEQDQQYINNDATLLVLQDGRLHPVTPCRIGAPQPPNRRDLPSNQRSHTNGAGVPSPSSRSLPSSILLSSIPNGIPISMQAHMKGVQPAAGPQMRISSGTSVRTPATSLASPLPLQPSQQASTVPQVTNGSTMPLTAIPAPTSIPAPMDGEAVKMSATPNGTIAANSQTLNGAPQQPTDGGAVADAQPPVPPAGSSPRSKIEVQQSVSLPLNGFHVSLNGCAIPSGPPYLQHARQLNSLTQQQMQSLKMVLASQGQDANVALQGTPGRQIQTPYVGQLVPNMSHFNIPMSPYSASGILPARTPSANSNRVVNRPGTMGAVQATAGHPVPGAQYAAHSLSPRLQHNSPPPLPTAASLSSHQSPSRPPTTPTLKMSSPSIQHQQPVPSSQGGY